MPYPEHDAPREVRERLIQKAGLNPYGRPMWRVCLAQNVYRKRGGVFCEMEDVKSMFTVGADGRVEYTPVSKRTLGHGYMEVPRYPHQGWILERWMPASAYGTRAEWEMQRGDDGSCLLGPYPAEGDYWMIAGPWPKLVETADLETAIDLYEHSREKRPLDLEAAVRQAIKNEEDERVERMHRLEAQLEEYRKSEILPMLKRVSLSAQMVRNQLQASLGLKSHFGAI